MVFGSYWQILKDVWEKRHHPNLHIVFYEDLKADIMGQLRKLDTFLGTKLTEDQLQNVAKQSSFGEMKARSALFVIKEEDIPLFNTDVVKKHGGFFRKGKTV